MDKYAYFLLKYYQATNNEEQMSILKDYMFSLPENEFASFIKNEMDNFAEDLTEITAHGKIVDIQLINEYLVLKNKAKSKAA
jgi:hypothetical protein